MTITQWRPDTCGCVIDFEWDPALPVEQRTHTCVAVKACEHHAHLPDHADDPTRDANKGWSPERHSVWHAVHEENQLKNEMEGHALDHLAHLTVAQTAPVAATLVVEGGSHRVERVEASSAPRWADHAGFLWGYDADRVLHVHILGGSDEDHAGLQQHADDTFGSGRAKVG